MCHNCLKWPSTSCWHISLPHSDVCSQFVFTSLPETILQLLNSLKGYKKGQFWPYLVNTCCAKFPNIPYGYLRLNLEKQQLFFQGSEAKVTAQCGHTVVALACRHEQVLQRTSNSHLAPTLFPQTLHNSHLIAFFVWQGAVALSGFVETQRLTNTTTSNHCNQSRPCYLRLVASLMSSVNWCCPGGKCEHICMLLWFSAAVK